VVKGNREVVMKKLIPFTSVSVDPEIRKIKAVLLNGGSIELPSYRFPAEPILENHLSDEEASEEIMTNSGH
jgi:hypothetical protein